MRKQLLPAPHIGAHGGTIGRPRAEPPPDAANRINALAADGFTHKGVALRMGVNDDVLRRWFNEHPELAHAFAEGRENERHTLHNKLFRLATEGTGKEGMVAAMFLLKARHGYREGAEEAGGSRLTINFSLPGAMKPEAFTVDNDAPRA